ncbi:ABC transporter ATP-binding protein [Tuberibacillus sp. Marseille-P3662]|uniref:ABC transporter ATP-binding protein n=1 Tax=Tuberibacillus sp. Marseille-P3662 TaxID=1965358 RepID=UPI000A1C99D3|nr:ABC transporter ATP-binding protein [Tuberibacillus sp. Marseille-P3662]
MELITEGLMKTFEGLTAVDNIDLTVEQGEITAIIGPNGAGKTTLFNLLSGFHKPTNGNVLFQGEVVTNLSANKIARLGISRTFQTTHLFEDATVLDNLIIGHRLRTKSGLWDALLKTPRLKREERQCREKAFEVLQFVEADYLASRLVHDISQEAKKRVAFALALATEPQLLLLDEPAGGVNPSETEGLAALIKKMKQSGLTVCLIEHKMDMVMDLADHIVVLNHGEKIAEGTPDEIGKNPTVIEAYLGGAYDAAHE